MGRQKQKRKKRQSTRGRSRAAGRAALEYDIKSVKLWAMSLMKAWMSFGEKLRVAFWRRTVRKGLDGRLSDFRWLLGGNCLRWMMGGNCPRYMGGNCPGRNCPRRWVGIVRVGTVRVGIVRWELSGWELSVTLARGGAPPEIRG